MTAQSRPQSANAFLARFESLYRMDRGDRIYTKRHYQRWMEVGEIIDALHPERILDVGCGSGFFMILMDKGIVGIDVEENVAVCKRRGLEAYVVDIEKERFPFENASFDVATCLEVLEHLKNPAKTFSETLRVLKPGGYLILSTPNSSVPTWRIRDSVLKFNVVGQIYMGRNLGKDEKRYGKNEIRELLVAAGFVKPRFYYSKIMVAGDDIFAIAKKPAR